MAEPERLSSIEAAREALAERPGLPFRTIAEIEAEGIPEIEWTVNGILPTGTLSIFSGPPKGGKSTTVASLAAAIADQRAQLAQQRDSERAGVASGA